MPLEVSLQSPLSPVPPLPFYKQQLHAISVQHIIVVSSSSSVVINKENGSYQQYKTAKPGSVNEKLSSLPKQMIGLPTVVDGLTVVVAVATVMASMDIQRARDESIVELLILKNFVLDTSKYLRTTCRHISHFILDGPKKL
ncbi:hypothetical protein Droror1_Dr00000305 [Drosera rotundifolia]